jgi:hypothetical protein
MPNEFAGKKKSVRITYADIYLKPVLAQVAYASMELDKYSLFIAG